MQYTAHTRTQFIWTHSKSMLLFVFVINKWQIVSKSAKRNKTKQKTEKKSIYHYSADQLMNGLSKRTADIYT